MTECIDHIGIAVKDLQKAVTSYTELFGFSLTEMYEAEEQKQRSAIIVPKGGGTGIELMEPTDPKGAVGNFISRSGEGIHHISLRVADIEGLATMLKENGIRLVYDQTMTFRENRFNFVHPKSMYGVLIELFERSS